MDIEKDEIELVLTKAFEYLKPRLKEKVSLVDIFDITQKVWKEVQEIPEDEDETIEFCLSSAELEEILAKGDLEIEYSDGWKVWFRLQEDDVHTITLENGGVLIWYDGD